MNESPIQIAVLVDQLGEGGAQRSATLVAENLHVLGFPVRVLAGRDGPYSRELPETLPVDLLAAHWPKPLGIAQLAMNLCRVTRRHRTEVLLANGFGIGRLALALRIFSPMGMSRRTRVVVVERNTISRKLLDRFPNRFARWVMVRLTRWLYRRADAILGVSEGVSRDLERALGLPDGSVTTIYNPVDTEHIAHAIQESVPQRLQRSFDALPRPLVITAGRLVRAKAHRDLLDAFASLPENQRGSLVILGEGPLREDLEGQSDRLGIRERVWMPGFIDNPWWFIARSDVFVLSSHWEGHPRAILEALACGVPIVSTDCPSGPREILGDSAATRLTPVSDTRALARGISEILLDAEPRLVAELGRYKPTAIAQAYGEIVARVAVASRAASRKAYR